MNKNSKIIQRILEAANKDSDNLCAPELDYESTLMELCDYFLGSNWNTCNESFTTEQVNMEIVYKILLNQYLKYRLFSKCFYYIKYTLLHKFPNSIPSISTEKAVHMLIDFLLGENWYVSYSCNGKQVNTEAVLEIEHQYHKPLWKIK